MVDTFHLLRTGKNQYLTMKPPKTKTMFLSFENIKTAHKCKEFIHHHKTKYGTWPNFNMERDRDHVEMDRMNSREPLYIEEKTLQDIEEMMQCSGTGVMYCYDFGIIPLKNSFTITFRAEELGVDQDIDRYLESLQNTLDS